jgi:hypothetical protein
MYQISSTIWQTLHRLSIYLIGLIGAEHHKLFAVHLHVNDMQNSTFITIKQTDVTERKEDGGLPCT